MALALALSRVIDNSVISIENIYRHLEMGALPAVAAQVGASEVTLAVLAGTLVAVVDFPGHPSFWRKQVPVLGIGAFVLYLTGRFFHRCDDGDSSVLLTFPQSCPAGSRCRMRPAYRSARQKACSESRSGSARFNNAGFNRSFNRILDVYERLVRRATNRPLLTVVALMGVFVLSFGLFPYLGVSFFPRSDAGQFTINLKAPTGSRIKLTNEYISRVEDLIRKTVAPGDFRTIVSNIGVVNDLSSLYTSNSGSYAATIQTQLTDNHKVGSYAYMNRVQQAIRQQFPDLRTFVQSGSMVDAVLNTGMPAPIDVQVTSPDLPGDFKFAQQLAARISHLDNVGQVYIPQDMDYPALRMESGSGACRGTRPDTEGHCRQRNNSPELERHDCAQLLVR